MGLSRDKDFFNTLAPISKVVDQIVFVNAKDSLRPLPAQAAFEAATRAQSPATLKEEERKIVCSFSLYHETGEIIPSIQKAVRGEFLHVIHRQLGESEKFGI